MAVHGFHDWANVTEQVQYAPDEVAIVIVDMRDRNCSRGVTVRCGTLA